MTLGKATSRGQRIAVSIFDAPATVVSQIVSPIRIFDRPGDKQASSKASSKDQKEEKNQWKEFLDLFYEGGKKKVENPNLKTRDIWPKVTLSTALKVPVFAKKIQEEFHRWKDQSDKEEKATPSQGSDDLIVSLDQVSPGDYLMSWDAGDQESPYLTKVVEIRSDLDKPGLFLQEIDNETHKPIGNPWFLLERLLSEIPTRKISKEEAFGEKPLPFDKFHSPQKAPPKKYEVPSTWEDLKRNWPKSGPKIVKPLESIQHVGKDEKLGWISPDGRAHIGAVFKDLSTGDILVVGEEKDGDLKLSFITNQMLKDLPVAVLADSKDMKELDDLMSTARGDGIEKDYTPLLSIFQNAPVDKDPERYKQSSYLIIEDRPNIVFQSRDTSDFEKPLQICPRYLIKDGEVEDLKGQDDRDLPWNAIKEGKVKRVRYWEVADASDEVNKKYNKDLEKSRKILMRTVPSMEALVPKKKFTKLKNAPSHWKPSSYIGYQIDPLIKDYKAKFGDEFKALFKKQKVPSKAPKRYLSQKSWDQLSTPEKKLWALFHSKEDSELLYDMFRNTLSDKEFNEWKRYLPAWADGSGNPYSLKMQGALSALGVKGKSKRSSEEKWKTEGLYNLPVQRALAKAIAFQQAFFDTIGLDKITLYRGGLTDPKLKEAEVGDKVEIENARELSSTTIDPSTALMFTDSKAPMIKMKAPVSQVIASPIVFSPLYAYSEREQAEVVLSDLLSIKGKKLPTPSKYENDPDKYADILKMAKLLIKSWGSFEKRY